MWMSEWQTPQKRISSCTSVGLNARRSIWKGARGVFGPWAAYALVTDIWSVGGVDREEFLSAEAYAPPHRSAIRGRERLAVTCIASRSFTLIALASGLRRL